MIRILFLIPLLILNGFWSLKENGGNTVYPCEVPGGVHSALMKAGVIKDTDFGLNEMDNLWAGRKDWIISRTFDVTPELLSAKAVYLRAGDVDTFCEISINGHKVGSTTNRFRRWEWDVKPYLHKGQNTVEGRFHSAEIESEKKYKQLGYTLPMAGVGRVPHLNMVRKPICHGGWDWGPAQMVTGFAGDVELIPVNDALVEYLTCTQDHSVRGQCKVTLRAEILSPGFGQTAVGFSFGDRKIIKGIALEPGINTVEQVFVVKNPKLWWPSGMGRQNLYRVSVSAGGSTLEKKIGLREIEIGDNLSFKVNGHPVFARGANWIPCDLYETRQTEQRYQNLLQSAKDANMNMLRVWGGGKYEKDRFYEICDSLGLLVWQDFMFSCAMYPSDEEFFGELTSEITHQIKRLQSHPSIALWCGDNEGMDLLNWRFAKKNPEFYKSEYKKLIDLRGSLVEVLDPERLYWPTSPCGGPGDLTTNGWKDDSKGDMHLWEVSKSALPLERYYGYKPYFCSEFGHSSFGGDCSVALEDFKFHIKEKGGYENIKERINLHFNPRADMESLVYLSQIEQALGLETAASYWRTLEKCHGVLVWQLNDIWPCSSWSTIEYDGSWKPAQYHLKRVFAPVAVTAVPHADSLSIVACNTKKVKVSLWTFAGKRLWSRSAGEYALSEFGSEAERADRFLYIEIPGTDAVKTWFFDEPKNLNIQEAGIRYNVEKRAGQTVIDFSSDVPAFYVWAEVPGSTAVFSDNSFTLLPGMKKRVVYYGDMTGELSVKDLYSESSRRSESLLQDGWRFHRGEAVGADAAGFDDSSWEKVSIPHDWAIAGPFDRSVSGRTGSLPWAGTGWYRRTFSVPQDKKVSLTFDGAMSCATVFVNGKEIYSWPNGYVPVNIDITDAVVPGCDNILAVRLENKPGSSRWYPGAGLFRNVHLVATDKVHVPYCGVMVTTEVVSSAEAVVCVKTAVDGSDGRKIICRTEILDADDNCVASMETTDTTALFEQNLKVIAPKLWSPASPVLYKAVTSIFVDGRRADEYTVTFGIRKAEFIDGEGFFLNGHPMKFQGVCLHHDLGPLGAAVNVAAMRHQLEMLKDMGCNSIRTSHNCPAPELVRLCDEMGMMMMVEAFDEWNSKKCRNGYHIYFKDWAEKDLTNIIRRFRNDPAVIFWSTGNEICREKDNPDEGYEEACFLTEICHREDPTRPVTVGMHMWHRFLQKRWVDAFDLIGVNYHPWKFLEMRDTIGDRLILGAESGSTLSSRGVYRLPAVKDRSMTLYPDRQCSSFDLESTNWSNTPDCDFAMYEDYPWAIGQFVWTGFDYLGEPTPYEGDAWPNHSSMFGIVDLASIPKDRYYLFRSVWNPSAPTLHILPHWNWEEGRKVPVIVYTNAPSAELFLNGKSLGVKRKAVPAVKTKGDRSEDVESRYRLRWDDIAYAPGELMAVSLDAAGNCIDTAYVRTAGKPARIRLEYDGRRLKADGEDLAYVTVSIIDKDGNLCPADTTCVTFEVGGEGAFKACANGDPVCTEAFQGPSMHAFNGKLTVIVQSTEVAGKAFLTASAPCLEPAALTIRTKY